MQIRPYIQLMRANQPVGFITDVAYAMGTMVCRAATLI